jgi:hypothetical protein
MSSSSSSSSSDSDDYEDIEDDMAVQMNDAQLAQLIAAVAPAPPAAGAAAAAAPAVGINDRKLPPFETGTAEDWVHWRMTFNAIATLKNWPEETRRAMIKASMQGYAIAAVSAVEYGPWPPIAAVAAAPGVPAVVGVAGRPELTSEQILDAYEAKFVTAANSTYARRQFKDAVQRHDESLVAWHTRLIMLYRRSEPRADMENARELREHFIDGISSPQVREYVMDQNPTTMSDCLSVATNKAATIASMQALQKGRRQLNSINALNGLPPTSRPGFNPSAVGNNNNSSNNGNHGDNGGVNSLNRRCYICRSKFHLQKDCHQSRPMRSGNDRTPNQTGKPKPSGGGRGGGPRRPGRGGPPSDRSETVAAVHAIYDKLEKGESASEEKKGADSHDKTKASGN